VVSGLSLYTAEAKAMSNFIICRIYGTRSGGVRNGDPDWFAPGMQHVLYYFDHTLITFSYSSDGTIHINTPYSCLLGKAPIMVAGVTPSTVKGGFVSAILSAGFHIELASGGH
jgi:hypothetical protein